MPNKAPYSVLIAYASDCDALRAEAVRIFFDKNQVIDERVATFIVFDWHKDARPEYVEGDLQDKIFDDAKKKWDKDTCDILVLIFWYKFGVGTKKEYEFFLRKKADGSIGQLFVCHYNELVEPIKLAGSGVEKLLNWTKKHKNQWAEISPVRGKIDNEYEYGRALATALDKYCRRVGI